MLFSSAVSRLADLCSGSVFMKILLVLFTCLSMLNQGNTHTLDPEDGHFLKMSDQTRIFIYEYKPSENYTSTIFIISGITGINHYSEIDLIRILGNAVNRVVVIHPRGTGYSEGKRGDIPDFRLFINDYVEIISADADYRSGQHLTVLFGHSMSTAVLLAVASELNRVGGAILVNPPFIMKKAKGMSPGLKEYLKYGWYYLFHKHKPVVNMAGDPATIENEEDRKESEIRSKDTLLVKYFSLYMMMESRRLMHSMVNYAKTADYPLLLLYGERDPIVDKRGCDYIFESWKCENKQYSCISGGSHGKSTVLLSEELIQQWIRDLN